MCQYGFAIDPGVPCIWPFIRMDIRAADRKGYLYSGAADPSIAAEPLLQEEAGGIFLVETTDLSGLMHVPVDRSPFQNLPVSKPEHLPIRSIVDFAGVTRRDRETHISDHDVTCGGKFGESAAQTRQAENILGRPSHIHRVSFRHSQMAMSQLRKTSR
jgi:hypothetical protein